MGASSKPSKHEMYGCPICQRQVRGNKTLPLFGTIVCKKCCYSFANRRQFAYFVDLILLWGVTCFGGLGYSALFPELSSPTNAPSNAEVVFWLVFSWIIVPIVFGMKDGFAGHSPGKWLMGVQVVDQDTREPIGFVPSLMRNLLLVVPVLPLIVALQLIKGYRWGDSWANTAVIWKKHRHRMPFDPRGILCTFCGYDLTGNVSGRCPECGRDIPVKAPMAAPVGVRAGFVAPSGEAGAA